MDEQAKCPNCEATVPDIRVFTPTQDEGLAGATSELTCKNCGRKYEQVGYDWQLK